MRFEKYRFQPSRADHGDERDGAVTQGAGWSDVLQAVPEAWPIPREVAGVELPDSKLARDATDYVRELSAPVVFNHVLRTYVFGCVLGRAMNLKFDGELFYLGAVFHDLGQTERFMGKQRFEVDGADAAAEFLQDKGVPKESIEIVWDAVALHTSGGIVQRKRPEIALVSAERRRMLLASALTSSPGRRSRK